MPWHDALNCGRLARIWNVHDNTSPEDLPQGAQDTLPDWDALEFECRVQETNTNIGLNDICYYDTTAKLIADILAWT